MMWRSIRGFFGASLSGGQAVRQRRSDGGRAARKSATLPSLRVAWRRVLAAAALGLAPAGRGLAQVGATATESAAPAVSGSLFGELLLIALIAACGWVVVYLVKRRTRAFSAAVGDVRVVGGTPLGARERVVVVTAQGRLFLLGVTPQQVSLLTELHSNAAARSDFEALLAEKSRSASAPASREQPRESIESSEPSPPTQAPDASRPSA